MKTERSKILQETGTRLRKLREELGYTRKEMAKRLGLTTSGYSRNETGRYYPGFFTLQRLSKQFEVSMDWLLFGREPMYYKEGEPQKEEVSTKEEDEIIPVLEKDMPDVRELLDNMVKDPLLRHEVFVHFYKYKKGSEEAGEIPGSSDQLKEKAT